MSVIKTVCQRDCPDTCFIDVIVDNGRIISTKGSRLNPVTQGFLCPRGMGDPKRVYSKNRVLYPHIKSDGDHEDRFVRKTWEECIIWVCGFSNLDRFFESTLRYLPTCWRNVNL